MAVKWQFLKTWKYQSPRYKPMFYGQKKGVRQVNRWWS